MNGHHRKKTPPIDNVVYVTKSFRGVVYYCINDEKMVIKNSASYPILIENNSNFIRVGYRKYVNCQHVISLSYYKVTIEFKHKILHVGKRYRQKVAVQYAEFRVRALHKDKMIS